MRLVSSCLPPRTVSGPNIWRNGGTTKSSTRVAKVSPGSASSTLPPPAPPSPVCPPVAVSGQGQNHEGCVFCVNGPKKRGASWWHPLLVPPKSSSQSSGFIYLLILFNECASVCAILCPYQYEENWIFFQVRCFILRAVFEEEDRYFYPIKWLSEWSSGWNAGRIFWVHVVESNLT